MKELNGKQLHQILATFNPFLIGAYLINRRAG